MAGVCVALVSGGIDSPVAVARMLMEGWKIYPVHASQEPVTGPEGEKKTIALLRHLFESEGRLGELARENLDRDGSLSLAEKLRFVYREVESY